MKKFVKNISGATAVEYSILTAGIGLVVFAVVAVLGTDIAGVFTTLSDAM